MYNIDQELVSRIKGLTMELTDRPQPELLIPIGNHNSDLDLWVDITTSEFTSLCPLAPTQPDYATLTIKYRPSEKLVELKSLKFYLVSFRNVLIFHEEVPSTILKALVELLDPEEMGITGDFTVRGGIHTVVSVVYPRVEGL